MKTLFFLTPGCIVRRIQWLGAQRGGPRCPLPEHSSLRITSDKVTLWTGWIGIKPDHLIVMSKDRQKQEHCQDTKWPASLSSWLIISEYFLFPIIALISFFPIFYTRIIKIFNHLVALTSDSIQSRASPTFSNPLKNHSTQAQMDVIFSYCDAPLQSPSYQWGYKSSSTTW